MKRLLTYGLLLLTILASHFVVSACQDDTPYEDTEVMVTFTTRAETTQGDVASSAIVQERMNNLRVIMVRANGDVVDNHVAENVTQTSVTFVFKTPIKTGGERFTFYAIANEVGLTPANEGELYWIQGKENMNGKMDLYKQLVVGTGSAFNAKGTITPEKYIPQTKYWAVDVPQVLSQRLEPQRLDYAVGKIMLMFDNKKNTDQSLNNIYISGILPNGKGYLFKQNEPNPDYVTYDVGSEKIINFEDVTVSQSSLKTLHYYTYPIDAANISNPTLHATWNGTEYSLELPGLSSLLRGQQLDIVVTLNQGLAVNFSIKDWEENNTNIGSPTTNGGYQVDGWGNGNDIFIGGEIGGGEDPEPEEPDVPELPGEEGEVTVWGEELGDSPITPEWANTYLDVQLLWFTGAETVTFNGIEGIQMYVYFTGDGQMQIRNIDSDAQYGALYLGERNYADGSISNISSYNGKLPIFIPNSVKNTPFRITGANYSINKITVVK